MLTLHAASMLDWASLYVWRTDPETRAASASTQPIPLDRHMEWLRDTLKSDTVRLYVALDPAASLTVGTGRLDLRGATAELSLTIHPPLRGKGYGRELVALLARQAQALGARTLRARVRPENGASLRAFASAGFVPTRYKGVGEGLVELGLDLGAAGDRAP